LPARAIASKFTGAISGWVLPEEPNIFGFAANLNIHLHGLVLDGVYCTSDEGAPVFNNASAPSSAKLQTLRYK
jgi:hypothetical protein